VKTKLFLAETVLVLTVGALFYRAASSIGVKGWATDWASFAIWAALAAAVMMALIALSAAERKRELRMAGIVVCGFALFLAVLIEPVLASARVAADGATCKKNLKELASSMLAYAADHDDRLPPAHVWQDGIDRYFMVQPGSYRCPSALGSVSYAFNVSLSGLPVEQVQSPADTVMLFEVEATGRNPFGGREWFVPRHSGSGMVGQVDGSVLRVRDAATHRWTK